MADTEDFKTVEDMSSDNATLLLEAAQSLELEPEVVRTSGEGFIVPAAVYDKAFGKPKASRAKASDKAADGAASEGNKE